MRESGTSDSASAARSPAAFPPARTLYARRTQRYQPEPGPLDPGRVRTNFVLFRVDRDRDAFLAAVRARGVLLDAYRHGQVRAVTHYGVEASDVEATIAAIHAGLEETRPAGGAAVGA